MKKKKRKKKPARKQRGPQDRIKKIAIKFVELEKKAQEDPNFDYAKEMEKLIHDDNLSIGDMLDIDYYIQNENLLTK